MASTTPTWQATLPIDIKFGGEYIYLLGARCNHKMYDYIISDKSKGELVVQTATGHVSIRSEAYVCLECGKICIDDPSRKLYPYNGNVAFLEGTTPATTQQQIDKEIVKVWAQPVNALKGNCECGGWKTGAKPKSIGHADWCAEFSMLKVVDPSEVEKCKAANKTRTARATKLYNAYVKYRANIKP